MSVRHPSKGAIVDAMLFSSLRRGSGPGVSILAYARPAGAEECVDVAEPAAFSASDPTW